MLRCPSSTQDTKALIIIINCTTILSIKMLANGRIEPFSMPGYCVVMDVSGDMLLNSNLKVLGGTPYIYIYIYIAYVSQYLFVEIYMCQ